MTVGARRAALALVFLLVTVAACRESSNVDMTSPTVPALPAGGDSPGALLDATGLPPAGAFDTWAVRYRSTSLAGDPIEVSGLVARPRGEPPAGGYPILSFAHGTTGIADDCAPSGIGADTAAGFAPFLDAGWVVALTDYEGLGTPGVHPYLVSESEGRGVLDAARAARLLVPEATAGVVLAGHSQGGHAALAAASIAEEWAPDLAVIGTIAVAPVADVSALLGDALRSPDLAGLAVLLAAAWPESYPELATTDLLDDAGSEFARVSTQGACIGEVDPDAVHATVVSAEAPATWRRRAEENSIDASAVAGPVLVVHGERDASIPPDRSVALVDALCDEGTDARYVGYEADHLDVYAAAEQDMIAWASRRADGEPFAGACET